MRTQRLKAQIGLLAAIIVLMVSLGVLMNQSPADRDAVRPSPAALSTNPPVDHALSLAAPAAPAQH